jgi:hypothetical protein
MVYLLLKCIVLNYTKIGSKRRAVGVKVRARIRVSTGDTVAWLGEATHFQEDPGDDGSLPGTSFSAELASKYRGCGGFARGHIYLSMYGSMAGSRY